MRGLVSGMLFLAVASFAVAGCQPSKPCHCTQQQGCHCPAPAKKPTPPPLPETGTEQGPGYVNHQKVTQTRHHRQVGKHYAQARHHRVHREARMEHRHRQHVGMTKRAEHRTRTAAHRTKRWATERSATKRSHRVAALPYNYRSGSHRMDSYSGGAAGSAESYMPAERAMRHPWRDHGWHGQDRGFHRYDRWKERHQDRGNWDERDESAPPDGDRHQSYDYDDHAERWTPPPHRQYFAARRIAPSYSINSGRANDPWHGYDADCPHGEAGD